jgi:hypothetical protein
MRAFKALTQRAPIAARDINKAVVGNAFLM